jgi:hypothetical protein
MPCATSWATDAKGCSAKTFKAWSTRTNGP